MENEAAHAQLRDLFDAIVDLPDAQRLARLEALTDDPALRAQVLRLARISAEGTSRATRMARKMDVVVEGLAGPEVGPGDVLGAWRLVSALGQGGMGAVFLAERSDGQFEQRAAIKVLGGLPGEDALARLGAERQILARLQHPHIARLFDGGSTPRGRPYLVMEHIEGVALDAYLRQRPRTAAEVLQLFLPICGAVAFAHAHLVVHCDLKPSNVLVDGSGRPMLLDFGISRLLGSEARQDQAGHAYTPRYASPELVANGVVGTATDVYSLGVMLGESLPGRIPADLHAIARCAGATDPADRYSSVTALADDLQRWLADRPVRAWPAGWTYTLHKLWRRRWPALLAAAAFLLVLLGFTWRLEVERDAAVAAREVARTEAATAGRAVEFLVSVFNAVDLTKGGSRTAPVWPLLEQGRERVAGELADQPAVRATLLGALGNVYANLGEMPRARELLEQAIATERALVPPRPAQLTTTLRHAAEQAQKEGRAADALPLARESWALVQQHAPPDSAERGRSATALGISLTAAREFAQAEALYLEHLRIRQLLHEPARDVASTWHNLGWNAAQAGDPAKAERYYREALAAKIAGYGENHVMTSSTQYALAGVLMKLRRPAEAEPLLQRCLATRIALYGENNVATLQAKAELIYIGSERGDYVACQRATTDLLQAQAASGGTDSADYARYLNNGAFCQERMGLPEAAATALRQALVIREKLLPPGDLAIARVQANLARALLALDRLDEAQPLIAASNAARGAKLPADDDERRGGTLLAIELARRSGDLAGARALLDALPPLAEGKSKETASRQWRERAWIEAAEGRKDAARTSMAKAVDLQQAHSGSGHPDVVVAELVEAELWVAIGDQDRASNLARRAEARASRLSRAFPTDSQLRLRLRRIP